VAAITLLIPQYLTFWVQVNLSSLNIHWCIYFWGWSVWPMFYRRIRDWKCHSIIWYCWFKTTDIQIQSSLVLWQLGNNHLMPTPLNSLLLWHMLSTLLTIIVSFDASSCISMFLSLHRSPSVHITVTTQICLRWLCHWDTKHHVWHTIFLLLCVKTLMNFGPFHTFLTENVICSTKLEHVQMLFFLLIWAIVGKPYNSFSFCWAFYYTDNAYEILTCCTNYMVCKNLKFRSNLNTSPRSTTSLYLYRT
jgi:hypothetical protein